jgi:hypothetical protein
LNLVGGSDRCNCLFFWRGIGVVEGVLDRLRGFVLNIARSAYMRRGGKKAE